MSIQQAGNEATSAKIPARCQRAVRREWSGAGATVEPVGPISGPRRGRHPPPLELARLAALDLASVARGPFRRGVASSDAANPCREPRAVIADQGARKPP